MAPPTPTRPRSSSSNGTALNRIFVVRPVRRGGGHRRPHLRPEPPDVRRAGELGLLPHRAGRADGIAFARVLTGGCGCGSFDMQMQSANSAIINPTTERRDRADGRRLLPTQQRRTRGRRRCASHTENTGATEGGSHRVQAASSRTTTACPATTSPATRCSLPMGSELAYITIPLSQDTLRRDHHPDAPHPQLVDRQRGRTATSATSRRRCGARTG